MSQSMIAGVVCVAGAMVLLHAAAAPPERTLTVDVIELVGGHEVQGKAEFKVVHEGIEYHFANSANRSAFTRDPLKFEVADGGACGRMGPLSGTGDARRYTVHDGRVYFFASDGCREGFKKSPERCIERADVRPKGTPEELAAGAATLDRMVSWAGGASALREMKTYRESSARERMSGNRSYNWSAEMAARFPGSVMTRESWGESWFSTVQGSGGAAMLSARGAEPLAKSRADAFDRQISRLPVVILHAWASARASGESSGITAVADGEGTAGGVPVDFVKVWLNGALSRFAVEKRTGRPVQQLFTGRDGTTSVCEIVRTFIASRIFSGIQLPTAWTVTADGKELPEGGVALDLFQINPELDRSLFAFQNAAPGSQVR